MGKEEMHVFEKSNGKEPKQRLVVNVGLGGYIVSAYTRYLIEGPYGGRIPWMTTPFDFEHVLEVKDLLDEVKRHIPLDRSAFDHHISHAAWLGFFDAMYRRYGGLEGILAFREVFLRSRWRYEEITERRFKGMPSGTGVTAVVNTIFNQVKLRQIPSPIKK
jgi:hypothetical protein